MRNAWIWLAIVMLSPHEAAAATAEDVARLRQEVDALAQAVQDERRRARDELTGLRAERAELDRQLRLERVRSATLRELEKEAADAAQVLDSGLERELEPARQALGAAREYLDRAIPFQLEARQRELDKVAVEIGAGDPARAMSRLWRFVQEEDAMGGEVSLSRQGIEVDGQQVLADVARIGMALLYYRFGTDRLAHAVRRDGGWRVEVLEDAVSRRVVGELFRALDDNRRLGAFELLLPEGRE